MANSGKSIPLFPKFEEFATGADLLAQLKGSPQVKLHRIMGQGKTKAKWLDLPPANIERKLELLSLNLPTDIVVPDSVQAEIEEIKREVDAELRNLKKIEGTRRLANQVLRSLSITTGVKDNNFYAGRLVLTSKQGGQSWSWGLTSHYPIVDNIPPDPDYLARAYAEAENTISEIILPPKNFDSKLQLAWLMARHFSDSDDVLLIEVAKMFKIAAQKDQFWNTPKKSFFQDLPEAAFIANLINWRTQKDFTRSNFEFVPATLHQAHGPKAKVFFMPTNPEGTQTRPVVYLRRKRN